MRVFQNDDLGSNYGPTLWQKIVEFPNFASKIAAIVSDYNGVHLLGPVLAASESAFYTLGNNEHVQRAWARENGLPAKASLEDILLAQVEAHRAEVFYNLNWSFDSRFSRRLPACVKAKIGWHAAPSVGADMSDYLVVCNFPSLLAGYRREGLRADFFSPSHDPALDKFAANDQRDIDVLFVGSYSQVHKRRAAVLRAVALLNGRYHVRFALARSRVNRLSETPFGLVGPLRKYRRPACVRSIATPPVYGHEYYELLGRSKIVLNGSGDIGEDDRGNMRCWEGLGARALLLSDAGNYPEGMNDGSTLCLYGDASHAVSLIERLMENQVERLRIADAGYQMTRTLYSKDRQWAAFVRLVESHFPA